MKDWKHDLSLRVVKILDLILITIPFAICWYYYYANHTAAFFAANARRYIIILYVLLFFIFGRVYDAFLISYNPLSEMVYSQVLAALIADGLIYLVICLLCKGLQPLWPGILAIAGQVLLAFLWAAASHWWYFHWFPPKTTYIVYDMRSGVDILIHEYGLTKKFNVKKVLPVSEVMENIDVLADAEEVFLSGVHSHDRNIIIKYCTAKDINSLVIPRIGDVMMAGAKKMHILHLPVFLVQRYNPPPEYLIFKRIFDILLSGITLIVTSPILLIVALLIKRDGGPAFYLQERLTKDGKTFRVIKFRSMRVDAEKDGVARLSTGDNDDRITPVGRVIRKVRLDELPQMFNILKGEMSIVGPRPERPEIAAEYEKEMPEFRLRLQCKAGLTGYAQVYGKYNTTPYDKLMMDLMYISSPGIVEDMRIMFATVKILFMGDSTEGVAEGQTTALGNEKEDRE